VKKNWLVYSLVFVLCVNVGIWYAVAQENRGELLTVTFLDVGQGDAALIEVPNGNQVLVDAGPPKTVLRELGKVLPFYDRTIDMMIVTNPDTDHMADFIDVLARYDVSLAMESGTISETAVYKELSKGMENEGIEKYIAERGVVVLLDPARNIYLHILFPDRDVSGLNRNDGSLIFRLVYGETSYMFTGDTTLRIENYLVSLGDDLSSDVLKVAHHGSKTSSSEAFVQAVSPQLAVISAGKDNSYGHPHKEVTGLFNKLKIKFLVTGDVGRVKTVSDGDVVEVKI